MRRIPICDRYTHMTSISCMIRRSLFSNRCVAKEFLHHLSKRRNTEFSDTRISTFNTL
ncbi:MAG: hypothetical protein NTX49_03885 [Chlamydiae bacterium]|nr:hypothetical protein [Chlamydiota bacterium]